MEFLLLFKAVCETLRAPEDFARVAREYAVDAAAQNVPYAELFISPSVWTYFQPNLDARAAIAAIREALDEEGSKHGLEVALIVDLTRNFGPEQALRTAELAVASRAFGVIGVGLGGDEEQLSGRPVRARVRIRARRRFALRRARGRSGGARAACARRSIFWEPNASGTACAR